MVSSRLEELDWQQTPMGELTLRRRHDPLVDAEVYEVKLGDEYLMSSLFTLAEEELARLGLDAVTGESLRVLVGGLGLGYTAVTALDDARVASMTVVDALPAVIDWHERLLLPVSARLVRDPRTRLAVGDFFAWMRDDAGPSAASKYDAILLDVDHSPRHQLDPSHADLYTVDGLRRLRGHLTEHGVFALWSDDPPDDEFMADLDTVFPGARAQVVRFDNPLTGGISANTVYVAGGQLTIR
ncbi:MAG TPA: spermidine synthase [Pseudolysinimonas sp.]|nr:spermidine synthase [Pseudolysinimonas sp.]